MSAASAAAADEADLIAGQKVVGCEMIQQMGILLRLPQVVLASAQVMFHRFYARRSVKKFDVRHFAMGALFLAAKVEEQPRKTRDVVNVANHLEQRRAGQAPQPVDIFSQRYATYKDRLVKAERELLKELGFILYTEHPHKFILNYAKLLTVDEGTSKRLAQHAWNFINDSQRTDACIKHAPEVICCAAIFMSARVLQLKLPSGWWELFDAQKDEMDAVVAQISALYSRPPARYVRLQPDPEPPTPAAPAPAPAPPPAPGAPLPRRRPTAPAPAAAPPPAAAAPPAGGGANGAERDHDEEDRKRRRRDDDDRRDRDRDRRDDYDRRDRRDDYDRRDRRDDYDRRDRDRRDRRDDYDRRDRDRDRDRRDRR